MLIMLFVGAKIVVSHEICKKMDRILESINKSNPDIQDLTMFIDIGDARYGAVLLIDSIEDAIDDIERKFN